MQRNVDEMYRGRKAGKKETGTKTAGAFISAAILSAALLIFCLGAGWYRQWSAGHCGIPDAVSSRTVNGECYLDVVANSDRIEDEAEFARTVVQMCRDNTFRSMRLSADQGGYPYRLEVSVYLKRGDVNETEPVFRIRFEPPEDEGGGYMAEKEAGGSRNNIKDHENKYKLYVDKREIPY